MAVEILTGELLRISLHRLLPQVTKTHPELDDVLTQRVMRTCSLLPDAERADQYAELGTLLIDLGRLYVAEAEVLRPAPEESGVLDIPIEPASRDR
jgi:hypothetical protein